MQVGLIFFLNKIREYVYYYEEPVHDLLCVCVILWYHNNIHCIHFSRASEVISCLDRVHQMKKQDVKPSSLYLKLILEQSGYFSRMSKSTADKDMKQHMPPVS